MEKTRDLILGHATRLFANQGFAGTSVRDIVEAAGVNVSLVSYHFGGKDGLYRECLLAAGNERLQITQSTLTAPNSARDVRAKIELFVERSLASLAADIDRQRLVAAELDRAADNFDELLKAVFLKVHETTSEFFAIARKKGYTRPDFEPKALAAMLRGLIINETRLERVKNKLLALSITDETHRKDCARHISGLFLDGALLGLK